MKKPKGFTLIELLVVVAIIGVLATVVSVSVNTARLKSYDATVKTEMAQLRTIMNQENTDTGSYSAIKSGSNGGGGVGWLSAAAVCTGFTGTYAIRAKSVCDALVKATGSACTTGCVWFGFVNVGGYDDTQKFSIMSYLPYESTKAGARYFCMGSSGSNSYADPWNAFTDPGCYKNP